MNAKLKIFILSILLFSSLWIVPQKATAQTSVSFQVFYDELSPYGTWVNYLNYGYVWIPDVSSDFTPYGTDGYWILSDAGWTWVSNYSWGWAPFHYGRWFLDPMYGYMWVPDNEWGPGWVTWRNTDVYYGWAPIGPSISINIAYSNEYYIDYNQWNFVRHDHFGRRDVNNYYVNHSDNVTIINNSTVINNVYVDKRKHVSYNTGPKRHDVERHTGRDYTPVNIKESRNPGQNVSKNQLYLYKPQVQKNIKKNYTPKKIVNIREVKSVEQRNAENQRQRNNQFDKNRQTQAEDQKRKMEVPQNQNNQRDNREDKQRIDDQNKKKEVTRAQNIQKENRDKQQRDANQDKANKLQRDNAARKAADVQKQRKVDQDNANKIQRDNTARKAADAKQQRDANQNKRQEVQKVKEAQKAEVKKQRQISDEQRKSIPKRRR